MGELLANGFSLVGGAANERDRYGRLLRYAQIAVDPADDIDGNPDGTLDVGAALVAEGYAIARYDSRDGYGDHDRQEAYWNLDALADPSACTPEQAATYADEQARRTGRSRTGSSRTGSSRTRSSRVGHPGSSGATCPGATRSGSDTPGRQRPDRRPPPTLPRRRPPRSSSPRPPTATTTPTTTAVHATPTAPAPRRLLAGYVMGLSIGGRFGHIRTDSVGVRLGPDRRRHSCRG